MLATEVGGEGRNLQFANVLVNYDLPWNPMKIEQRIGRLHRIGQTREVHVFSFCGKGSAEERSSKIGCSRSSRAQTDAEVAAGFDTLAEELGRARADYAKIKALDAALFERDFET